MARKRDKPVLLVALGGNALIRDGEAGTAEEQMANLKIPLYQIARLSKDYRIIITHGNGPQVGNLLLQQEQCTQTPEMPLEILVAQTEGQIGYMIESTLDQELMSLGIEFRPLVSLITYVVVDRNDPAFQTPTKPIGPIYTEAEIARLDYPTVRTATGYRRVVASPKPVSIVERREIKLLVDNDFIVICCGGGGIPVIRDGRMFSGVDAVIDKDLTSLCLAREIGVDVFLIASDVDNVLLNYGTPEQRPLSQLGVSEAKKHLADGQFPDGSMGPKVRAAAGFVKYGGSRAIITSVKRIEEAVAGNAGTVFYPDITDNLIGENMVEAQ